MSDIKEKLSNMFSKVMAGTVTREEGALLLNFLVKENQADTIKELTYLIETPPPGVFPKTILHTIALARNKVFYNIIVSSLESKNEDVSILAAQELGNLKTSDAKNVLVEHLNNESYHVRKYSALALCQGFIEGPELLKKEIISNPEPFFRSTYAQALARGGKKGIEALLGILSTGPEAARLTAAEVLNTATGELQDKDIPKVFDALMLAGDNKDTPLLIELLKLAGALKKKVKGFEGFVKAFEDYPEEPVREEAKAALRLINGQNAFLE